MNSCSPRAGPTAELCEQCKEQPWQCFAICPSTENETTHYLCQFCAKEPFCRWCAIDTVPCVWPFNRLLLHKFKSEK